MLLYYRLPSPAQLLAASVHLTRTKLPARHFEKRFCKTLDINKVLGSFYRLARSFETIFSRFANSALADTERRYFCMSFSEFLSFKALSMSPSISATRSRT